MAKQVPWTYNEEVVREEVTEIKQTRKDWNNASKVYVNDLIKLQNMARMKRTSKRVVWEDQPTRRPIGVKKGPQGTPVRES